MKTRRKKESRGNELGELIKKCVSEELERFKQKLQESLDEKNYRIIGLTRIRNELEEKARQQEEIIKKIEREMEGFEENKKKELETVSDLYKDTIQSLKGEIKEKSDTIENLKTKETNQVEGDLVKKLKSKLIKRKEKNENHVRKLKAKNDELINLLKIDKDKMKSATEEIEGKDARIKKLEEEHRSLVVENEELEVKVAGLLLTKEGAEDREIKMKMLVEKGQSDEKLIKDISARNKTLYENFSKLKDSLKDLQFRHDAEAHGNLKKQDEIDKLLGLNQTLEDERLNKENELKTAKEAMEELREDVVVCKKSLNETKIVKMEITRMSDSIYEDNQIMGNELGKLREEKIEFEKVICK